jgi:predicted nuclease of predicted toxin-antitoxin system
LKFLVDECTGIYVDRKLKQVGYDSVSVIECMAGASDDRIIRKAIDENRVIITNDKYFGRLAGFNRLPGMILLRLKDETAENKVKVVSFIIKHHFEIICGNILVASEKKIRVQKIKRN